MHRLVTHWTYKRTKVCSKNSHWLGNIGDCILIKKFFFNAFYICLVATGDLKNELRHGSFPLTVCEGDKPVNS